MDGKEIISHITQGRLIEKLLHGRIDVTLGKSFNTSGARCDGTQKSPASGREGSDTGAALHHGILSMDAV